MFIEIHQGYSRIGILIGGIAIKIPNFTHGDRAVVMGMHGNIHEYEIYQTAYSRETNKKDKRLAKVYFRLPFGVALFTKRYKNIITSSDDLPLVDTIKSFLTNIDMKPGNFAKDQEEIVVIDYGNSDVWYIG